MHFRYYFRVKSKQDYTTLNCTINSARSRSVGQTTSTPEFVGSGACATGVQNAPTHSVFVGETDLNESSVNPLRTCYVAHSGVAQ